MCILLKKRVLDFRLVIIHVIQIITGVRHVKLRHARALLRV
jgi:hypothetical protein